jgi:hypothetical protein
MINGIFVPHNRRRRFREDITSENLGQMPEEIDHIDNAQILANLILYDI